ncbi:switch-activating protein Sap1 [Schizosaccharomyces octosporus yFS286]|uniref:Switch-activating protein Sap1 n=1 Tax=Schizosaccharomyces octosporus (strain yFS286) TaxID=483514 RepID=S9PRV0_SCHOY|nr:switch-activating protein Sap1 [Schizosaccharomyces octosporus yFS286]EPX71911.1 switch-activating protein Sap1 [Schizosaccharomyces octosporus yFS286]
MEAGPKMELKSYKRKNASLSPSSSPAKAQRTHLSLEEKIKLMRLVVQHKHELVDRKTSEFYAKIARIGYENEGLAIHTESACRNQIISIMRVYEQRLAHRQPGMKTTPEEDELDQLCDEWKARLSELQQYREKFLVGKRKCDCNDEINERLKKLTEDQQNVDMLVAKVNFLSKHLHDNEEKIMQLSARVEELYTDNKRIHQLLDHNDILAKMETHSPYGPPHSVNMNPSMTPNMTPNMGANMGANMSTNIGANMSPNMNAIRSGLHSSIAPNLDH